MFEDMGDPGGVRWRSSESDAKELVFVVILDGKQFGARLLMPKEIHLALKFRDFSRCDEIKTMCVHIYEDSFDDMPGGDPAWLIVNDKY